MNGHLLRFWGKTLPATSGSAKPHFKPALHHLFDVAAVALELQAAAPHRLAREASALGVALDALHRVRAVLAGLHDLGKISAPFQAKVPALWPADILGKLTAAPDHGHWRITARMLAQASCLKDLRPLMPDLQDAALDEVIGALAGHHGRPPDHDDLRPLIPAA